MDGSLSQSFNLDFFVNSVKHDNKEIVKLMKKLILVIACVRGRVTQFIISLS